MTEPYLIVYGNCQAGMLAQSIKFVPGIRERYRVHYVCSFDHPMEKTTPPPADVLEKCAIYWRQYDEQGFNAPDDLIPPNAQRVVFPPLDFGPLWPFQCYDPVFKPEPPEYPFGRFPYGDRMLKELSEETPPEKDIYQAYNDRIDNLSLDTSRHLDIEFERLRRRDVASDIKLAPFVISTFKVERLFWCYNHPTKRLFGELFDRMIRQTWADASVRHSDLYRIGRFIYREWDPFKINQVPICDYVGKELGLVWWSPEMKYDIAGLGDCTNATYCESYVGERRKRMLLDRI